MAFPGQFKFHQMLFVFPMQLGLPTGKLMIIVRNHSEILFNKLVLVSSLSLTGKYTNLDYTGRVENGRFTYDVGTCRPTYDVGTRRPAYDVGTCRPTYACFYMYVYLYLHIQLCWHM